MSEVSNTPSVFLSDPDVTLWHGDALETLRGLPDESVDCVVTSPPYWGMRDYGVPFQIGLEATRYEYVGQLVRVCREVQRVLAPHGTMWLNLGDTFVDKQLVGVPWLVAFALQAEDWLLRSDVIWSKPNAMPEAVSDRPTKAHEYVFMFTKQSSYYFNQEAVREPHNATWKARDDKHPHNPIRANPDSPIRNQHKRGGALGFSEGGRNIRSVWEIITHPYPDAHFATFPEELVRRCIAASTSPSGVVLDPFVGSGTTCYVARKLGHRSVGIDVNELYLKLAANRLRQQSLFTEVSA